MEDAPNTAPETPLSEFEEMEQMKQRFMDAQDSRELLAVHEAGHAAVAEHFDMGVVKVILRGPSSSFTEVNPRSPSKDTLLDDLTVALAGYYAALKETGEEYLASVNCGIDYVLMDKLFAALSINEKEQKPWMKEAQPLSEQLVGRYWAAVKKIGDVLFQKGEMTGAEVRQILAEVQK
jgi:hypothetical protein